jgi:ABC-type phosphate transport system substrate-binding protein
MTALVFRTGIRTLLLALACVASELNADGGVVVIGNANLARLDVATLEKVYTGKVIEVDGIPVKPVNATSGSAVRNRFLQVYLNEDEDKYTAYWTVRRYIGKGASPRELSNSNDVISFVKSTPGAIGYIDEEDVRPGVNVLLKPPR